MIRPVLLSAVLLLVLSACTSRRETDPPRSATEQLLFSTAADRAADKLTFSLQPGTKVFVDGSFVEGTDSKYLISAIRDRVMRKGGDLTDDKGKAELTIEPRVGALSVDRDRTLFGLPAIPVPLVGIEVPEIAIFKRSYQQGVVKLAATTYDPKTGLMVQSLDPVYAFSSRRDWTFLIFFSWSTTDLMPDEDKKEWVGD
ncbi:MAG: hypothetical protein OJJ21_06055 [Ferrovibrio sp.]|uniref:DUF6655 family protein n=1 Tax=Ferrovibrio sp. TaxID=1917215 RepID=UPI00260FC8E1|nr:DUF6655 family protein [Ferrovibrio sp.]MCW0233145.1 hypothetical protein [Ferrovibrio sp.]